MQEKLSMDKVFIKKLIDISMKRQINTNLYTIDIDRLIQIDLDRKIDTHLYVIF